MTACRLYFVSLLVLLYTSNLDSTGFHSEGMYVIIITWVYRSMCSLRCDFSFLDLLRRVCNYPPPKGDEKCYFICRGVRLNSGRCSNGTCMCTQREIATYCECYERCRIEMVECLCTVLRTNAMCFVIFSIFLCKIDVT